MREAWVPRISRIPIAIPIASPALAAVHPPRTRPPHSCRSPMTIPRPIGTHVAGRAGWWRMHSGECGEAMGIAMGIREIQPRAVAAGNHGIHWFLSLRRLVRVREVETHTSACFRVRCSRVISPRACGPDRGWYAAAWRIVTARSGPLVRSSAADPSRLAGDRALRGSRRRGPRPAPAGRGGAAKRSARSGRSIRRGVVAAVTAWRRRRYAEPSARLALGPREVEDEEHRQLVGVGAALTPSRSWRSARARAA